MISFTTVLNDEDWRNLNGNEVYVTMLRNKVKVELDKEQKVRRNSDDFKRNEEDSMLGVVLEYLKEVPEDLVYYNIDDVFGWKTVYVYFLNAMDKENFFHYYNTQSGITKTTK
tara:strand:+ start:1598 stop:1936 length:339 start_codon:yes stop_codon:yes gene_type:complete